MLYGSRAAGFAREGSDIDLIVVSNDWRDRSQCDRLDLLGIAAARIFEPVQAQGFTSDEISQQEILPFWQYIIREQAIAV